MRRFVLVGQTALASGEFSLEDLASSSGRLDALLRAVRAAFLVSHGLRREVQVYLVLHGGGAGPRVLRIDGQTVKFLRPDERSLAILVQKSLSAAANDGATGTFREVRPGISVCQGDLEQVLAELGDGPRFLLDERGTDFRSLLPERDDAVFFIGDHLGFDTTTLERLHALGARPVSVGPVSLHSEDVVSLVSNELDRRFGPALALPTNKWKQP